MMHCWRAALLLILVAMSSACTPATDLEESFDDYQQRLSRLLASPLPEPVAAPVPIPFPAIRDSVFPIPEVSIALNDLWSLRNCDLARLISERNSILGKVQPPVARFEYEVTLLRELVNCQAIAAAEQDDELVALLKQIETKKQGHLTLQFDNLLYGDREMRGLFKTDGVLSDNGHQGYLNTLSLLQLLTELQQNLAVRDPISEEQVERLKKLLAANYGNHYLGRLLQTLRYTSQRLSQTSDYLKQNQQRLQCPHRKPTQTAEYLQNVLNNIYAQRLLPQMSDTYNNFAQLRPLILGLYARASKSDYFAQFEQQAVLAEFKQVSVAHSHTWQQLLSQCGLSPRPANQH